MFFLHFATTPKIKSAGRVGWIEIERERGYGFQYLYLFYSSHFLATILNTHKLYFYTTDLLRFTLSYTHFLCDDITSLNFNFIQYNTLMVITQHFKGSQISTKKGKLNSSLDSNE